MIIDNMAKKKSKRPITLDEFMAQIREKRKFAKMTPAERSAYMSRIGKLGRKKQLDEARKQEQAPTPQKPPQEASVA